ncbi:MAG: hypothetical protein HC806_06305 [Anaerolineae bacterium]|nr:hypothetical protein [Anaerolineae bacterium]
MNLNIRKASLEDVAFLADVVIQATIAQERFGSDFDEVDYRNGYEEWTRETIMDNAPDCTLSVIELDNFSIGRLRVYETMRALPWRDYRFCQNIKINKLAVFSLSN